MVLCCIEQRQALHQGEINFPFMAGLTNNSGHPVKMCVPLSRQHDQVLTMTAFQKLEYNWTSHRPQESYNGAWVLSGHSAVI